ncbi:MAG TPA: complex I NDUFA9 subunit family protein [Gaiellaceae bacterium]|nr:complex I NDUFA9 subunit family protein [Gaiellaceae bacterium]
MKILVTGGTGFVGPRIVHALRAQDRDVRVLVRSPERGAHAQSIGAELAVGDVTDPDSLAAAANGCTHVIHLVAILTGKPAAFDLVMTQGTRNLVDAARNAGVERFVLMSALGTGDVPYYRAKHAMEETVKASGLEHVIFRPSFVFGHGGALSTFVKQVKYSPVVTVIGPGVQRSQPIWIDDVAAYFAASLDHPRAANRTFEIGGPDVVTWNELYRKIADTLGKKRALVHVPFGVARAGARLTQSLPGAPLSADQVEMLAGPDNVVSNDDAVNVFGLPLMPLAEQLRRAA